MCRAHRSNSYQSWHLSVVGVVMVKLKDDDCGNDWHPHNHHCAGKVLTWDEQWPGKWTRVAFPSNRCRAIFLYSSERVKEPTYQGNGVWSGRHNLRNHQHEDSQREQNRDACRQAKGAREEERLWRRGEEKTRADLAQWPCCSAAVEGTMTLWEIPIWFHSFPALLHSFQSISVV